MRSPSSFLILLAAARMFGSLVVCLPQPHSGGQLRVSGATYATSEAVLSPIDIVPAVQGVWNGGITAVPASIPVAKVSSDTLASSLLFDWGALIDGSEPLDLHWAAFYSDCPHEILPVASGNR